MNLLITGVSGFVGRALATKLIRRGLQVRGAMRSCGELPSGVEACTIGAIDGETDWMHVLKDVDVVVHLAARGHLMKDAAADPLAEFRKINLHGTEKLAREAACSGVKRLVFLSSIKVNDESTLPGAPFDQTSPAKPQDPYAISKWEAEQVLTRVAAETSLEVVVLRCPLVYGSGVKGNFLRLLQAVDRGIPLPFALTRKRRSLIYLDNLTGALATCLAHPVAAGKTYLVSDSEDVSTAELITGIAHALGKSSRLWPCPLGLIELAGMMTGKSDEVARLLVSLCIDSSKIRSELGWTPSHTVTQGLAETARWFRGRDNRG